MVWAWMTAPAFQSVPGWIPGWGFLSPAPVPGPAVFLWAARQRAEARCSLPLPAQESARDSRQSLPDRPGAAVATYPNRPAVGLPQPPQREEAQGQAHPCRARGAFPLSTPAHSGGRGDRLMKLCPHSDGSRSLWVCCGDARRRWRRWPAPAAPDFHSQGNVRSDLRWVQRCSPGRIRVPGQGKGTAPARRGRLGTEKTSGPFSSYLCRVQFFAGIIGPKFVANRWTGGQSECR